jgi:hypothetical protein
LAVVGLGRSLIALPSLARCNRNRKITDKAFRLEQIA